MVALAFVFFGIFAVSIRFASLSPRAKRLRVMRLQRQFSRVMLRLLKIRVTIEGLNGREFTGEERLLLLPNHISYLDVLVINSLIPAVFVTSREIEATPVLGQMTRAAGCVFVERRHKGDVHRDIDALAQLLNSGYNVALFPEGSTSPGDKLLEFKKTLLESAIRSRCRVLPLCVRYERIGGETYDLSNRDQVAWYGDMTFFPHFWRLMRLSSVEARLAVLEEVPFRGHRSRKRLAGDVKNLIASRLNAF